MSKAPRRTGRSLADMIGDAGSSAGASEPSQPPPAALKSAKPVVFTVLMTHGDRQRLRQLSLDEDTSLQQLGIEAFSLLMEKRGLPPLQPQNANRQSGG